MLPRFIRTKAAFDLGGLHEMVKNPAVLGPLMATQPHMIGGLAGATGGVGLMGLLDMIHHGGGNMGSFFKGPIQGRGPAVPPAGLAGTVLPPSPRPNPNIRPIAPPPPPRMIG